MSSNIARIVDYTAVMAADMRDANDTLMIKSIHGGGQGTYDDPLRPGRKVEACPAENSSVFAHWSGVPSAPAVDWVSQSGTVELTWVIPMRLWLPKTDEEAIRTALPFYDKYLETFISNTRLWDGSEFLVLRSQIMFFRIGGSKDWSWLDVGLQAVERVSYS